ncbi:MAG TPA: N-acetylmuramoyl-L-alanine amidase [Devosia sp.]|nr:N-acetylmuramoyl-L-alanine amidase [Devosia sp.]
MAAAWLLLLPFLGGSAFAQAVPGAAGSLPEVVAARVSTTPERGRLVIDLSASTPYAIVALDNPERIAVDVRAGKVDIGEAQPVSGTGIIAGFTTTMAESDRARTELTLNVPALVQQAYMLEPIDDQPARLVVDLVTTTASNFKAQVAADLASAMARGETPVAAPPSAPPPSAEGPAPPAEAAAIAPQGPAGEGAIRTAAAPDLAATPPAAPEPLKSAAPAGSRPLIVIDPGHGGVDNGASGPNGVREKDITLAVALQLRDLLVKSGQFDVAMTRDDDTYLTLNERVDLARQNKASLFISLHADTFQESDIRGASIYTRDERATDILDKVLADGENRADIVAGYVPPDTRPEVVDVLVDLMRRQVRQQAYLAAEDILKALAPGVALRRFPLRQADFFVLQAPDIPSMLIELGFLSNTADISNLEDAEWRNKVVNAIATGVETYFKSANTTVAAGG